jgi:hypothetical protein
MALVLREIMLRFVLRFALILADAEVVVVAAFIAEIRVASVAAAVPVSMLGDARYEQFLWVSGGWSRDDSIQDREAGWAFQLGEIGTRADDRSLVVDGAYRVRTHLSLPGSSFPLTP